MMALPAATVKALRAAAARRFAGDDDLYRGFLASSLPGKQWADPERPATHDLTEREARRLIVALNTGIPPKRRAYDGQGRAGDQRDTATQDQVDEIARLESDLGWIGTDRLAAFVARQLGEATPIAQLTRRSATSLITGLRRTLTWKRTQA